MSAAGVRGSGAAAGASGRASVNELTARRPLVVAAPDSFKGSVSASEAAHAMLAGARQVFGDEADYVAVLLADGGEGTLDAMLAVWGTAARTVTVRDALGRSRNARYGLSPDGRTAIIEAAEANGLPWVSDVALRPLEADTAGIGDLVRDALGRGVSEILLSVGGSATNDGGTGLLRELGARFLDAGGEEVASGARGLVDIVSVDASGIDPRALAASWRIAVDVQFPLCGPDGAAAVFGPQKGASPEDVSVIDTGLNNLATVLATSRGIDPAEYTKRPGFGAAGGLPLTTVALLGAETIEGSTLVSQAIGLPALLENASLVLTGEGQLDAQSVSGKVIDMVSRTRPRDVPLIVIAGSVALSAQACRAAGITAAFSIAPGPVPLSELMDETEARIEETAAQVCRLINLNSDPAH